MYLKYVSLTSLLTAISGSDCWAFKYYEQWPYWEHYHWKRYKMWFISLLVAKN